MKSNITQIKSLLDKFYECETTENEEEILKEYFAGDVAPEFEVYAPQFRFYKNESEITHNLSKDFDKKVLESINRYESKSVHKIKSSKYWYSFAAAASMIVIFGLYFIQKSGEHTDQNEYTHTVDALILISEKMDLASTDLQKLESFENGFNQLDALILLENYGKQFINK